MSDDQFSTSDIDWRYRAVTTIAKDAKLLSGKVAKAGTSVSVTTFIKHGETTLSIGDPSAPALFLSQSHKSYVQAIQNYPFTTTLPIEEESKVSAIVYDYLECIMTSVLFVQNPLQSAQ